MPNWCTNILKVEPGEEIKNHEDKVLRLKEFMGSVLFEDEDGKVEEFKAQKIIPLPDGKWNLDWCISNWGSKWDATEVFLETRGLSDKKHPKLKYFFETAWSPILPVTYRLSELFPDLIFEHYYEEPGMDFKGKYVFKNGEVLHQSEERISDSRKEDE